jgi:hypothetical protein
MQFVRGSNREEDNDGLGPLFLKFYTPNDWCRLVSNEADRLNAEC